MRKSESINLRWTDIDFEKGLAILKDTKSGESRLNPIPSFVLDEMKPFRQVGNSLIFASPNNTEKPFGFRIQWDKVREVACITNFRFHDLRQTAASSVGDCYGAPS